MNKTIYYSVKRAPVESGWRNVDYYKMYTIIDNKLLLLIDTYLGGDTIKTDDELVQNYINKYKTEYSEWEIQQL